MGDRASKRDLRHHRAATRIGLFTSRQYRCCPGAPRFGIGKRLLDFAEAEALRRGYSEIRLYTHETMIENQRLYSALGYEETGRATQAGYNRVYMCKQLGSIREKLTPR
jgi:ribosomal protein S18 acetylase RimI-like enzyme